MFDNHHGVIPKSENWTQELLPLYRAIEAHISITEGVGLNLCNTNLVNVPPSTSEARWLGFQNHLCLLAVLAS